MDRVKYQALFKKAVVKEAAVEPVNLQLEGKEYLDATRIHRRTGGGGSLDSVGEPVKGLRSTVIKRADRRTGMPVGFDPRRQKKILIDPDRTGGQIEIDPEKLTPQALAAALSAADALIQELGPDADATDEQRRMSAALYHIAEMQQASGEGSKMATHRNDGPAKSSGRQPVRGALAALLPQAPVGGGYAAAAESPAASIKEAEAARPNVPVVAQLMDGSGMETWYHDVVLDNSSPPRFIVLVYDTRWRGNKWRPPQYVEGAAPPQFALQIAGGDAGFTVSPTPFVFVRDRVEYTVLRVTGVHSLAAIAIETGESA